MTFSITIYLSIVTAIAGVTCLVVLANLLTAPVMDVVSDTVKTGVTGEEVPLVSVLVPARNEELTIGDCLASIGQQDYPRMEIMVLDDNSGDKTAGVVKDKMKADPRISMYRGEPLPGGWTGKNWACHQLAGKARGEYFLFMDADVRLAPYAVRGAMQKMTGKGLSLLSSFPGQVMVSPGEWLVVPLMDWLLLTFLPLVLVYRSRHTSFVAANGQFMLWNRKDYHEMGGHRSVGGMVVEDMELARLVKEKGKRMMTALGRSGVTCRMYDSMSAAVNGFAKNFFAGFNMHWMPFVLMVSFFLAVYLVPFFLLAMYPVFIMPVLLVLVQRLLLSLKNGQNPFWNILLHPVQMCLMGITGLYSVMAYKKGLLEWKDRKLPAG